LSAVRITWAVQFRNARDGESYIDALRQAGMSEWPFGFTADERDRLKGAEIASLVLGHVLQGQLEPGGLPAVMQIGPGGAAAFRSTTQMFTETVYVDGDQLCEQSENMFGRPDCGPVYRRSGDASSGVAGAYTLVNSGKVFHFTPAD
jgi:hypothetical protein